MFMIYFISDTHFYHNNIIKYCNRPFKDTDEMNNYIINKWNKTVTDNDIVYHLGDVTFTDKEKTKNVISKLNGRKYLIRGNHDKHSVSFYKDCGFIDVYNFLILDGYLLVHYPLKTDSYMKENLKNFIYELKTLPFNYVIHGHIHNTECGLENHFNVSVENIDYKPISFEEIKGKTLF